MAKKSKKIDSELKLAACNALLDASIDPIVIVSPKGKILDINKAVTNISGWKPKELIGKNFLTAKIIAKKDIRLVLKNFRSILKGQKLPTFEIEINKKPKGTIIASLTATPIKKGKKLIGVTAHFRDVTNHKRAEWALSERMKELYGIYNILKILHENADIDIAFKKAVLEIPKAYQFPKIICARITYKNKEYKTPNFKKTRWKQTVVIKSGKKNTDSVFVEAFYLKNKKFLDEEKKFLKEIAKFIKNIAERRKVEVNAVKSETKYRNLAENIKDIVYTASSSGKISYMSPRLKDFGFKEEDIVGKNLLLQIHPQDRMRILKEFSNTMKTGAEFMSEFRIVNPKGKVYWIEDNSRAVKDGKGKIIGISGILRDITERKRIEEKFENERARAQRYLDVSGVIMLALDESGKITMINKTGADMLGYRVKELIGKDWFEFVPQYLRAAVKRLHANNIKTPEKFVGRHENSIVTKNGEERIINWYNSVLRNKKGQFTGILSSGEDITEQKNAEATLQAQEEKYHALYDTSADAIMMLTPEKGFFAGNPATVKMFACKDEAEFIKQTPWTTSPEYQPDGQLSSKKAMKMIGIAMEKGTNFFEWTHKRLNGEEFFATVLLTRMKIGNETVLQATVRDISKQKEAEKRMSMLSQALEQERDGVVVTDLKRNIVYVNQSWRKTYSKTISQGRLIDKYFTQKDTTEYLKMVKMLDSQASMMRGLKCASLSGKKMPCLLTITKINDSEGKPFAILHNFQDITDQAAYEKSLMDANSRLKKAVDDVKKSKKQADEQLEITRRLNRHMVGRELRMKELKDEIKKIKGSN